MRSDESLPTAFREDKSWRTDPNTGAPDPSQERLTFYYGPDYHRHSYSGYERNKFYLNLGGKTFVDLSGISGADDIADSRTWAAIDYDGAGWTAIALVYSNTGEIAKTLYVKVLLVGGAEGGEGDGQWSNRDGVGAVVEVSVGGRTLRRVRNLGEGYAAQNSATLTVGISHSEAAESIKVSWPSGKVTEVTEPPRAGSSIIIRERH